MQTPDSPSRAESTLTGQYGEVHSATTCAINTKIKARAHPPNYAHYILRLGTQACFVPYIGHLHQRECLPCSVPMHQDCYKIAWGRKSFLDLGMPISTSNILLGLWSPCIQHPGAWFLFIKRKPVLFFIPITCCSKWLKSFKDSKCWKTAVCWCEQRV